MNASPNDRDPGPVDQGAAATAPDQQGDRAIVRQIIVWFVVLVPLTYGVFNTVEKAIPLF